MSKMAFIITKFHEVQYIVRVAYSNLVVENAGVMRGGIVAMATAADADVGF